MSGRPSRLRASPRPYESEVVDVSFDRETWEEFVIQNFDEALEQGRISVFYQPIMCTRGNTLVAVEALARWADPEHGLLKPAQFIGVLEGTRQVAKLDLYVLREVCRTLRQRLDQGLEVVPVSVNLSRLDFSLCDIYQEAKAATEEFDVPCNLLCLEITESMEFRRGSWARCTLDELHAAGFQVWIDDFGSGYASLGMLRKYPFDLIKIDMAFVADLSERSRRIVASVVSLAHRIGVKTLAEGVETPDQLEFLYQVGCENAQGYYVGRPAPCDEMFARCAESGLLPEREDGAAEALEAELSAGSAWVAGAESGAEGAQVAEAEAGSGASAVNGGGEGVSPVGALAALGTPVPEGRHARPAEVSPEFVVDAETAPTASRASSIGDGPSEREEALAWVPRGMHARAGAFPGGVADWKAFSIRRDARLWRALVDSGLIRMFWKDKDRRYLGADRSFMEYCGLSNGAQFLGKTTEDMGWHIDQPSFVDDEERVLSTGETMHFRLGDCVVDGQLCKLAVSETPIFANGEVDGLLGYFVDLDELRRVESRLRLTP